MSTAAQTKDSASETRLCGAKPSFEEIVQGKVVAISGCEPTTAEIIEAHRRVLSRSEAENKSLRDRNRQMELWIERLTDENRQLRERLERIERAIGHGGIGPS